MPHPDHPLAASATRADRELAIGPGLWCRDQNAHPVLKSLDQISGADLGSRHAGSPDHSGLGFLIMNELQSATPPLPQGVHQLLARLLAGPAAPCAGLGECRGAGR